MAGGERVALSSQLNQEEGIGSSGGGAVPRQGAGRVRTLFAHGRYDWLITRSGVITSPTVAADKWARG